MQIYDVFLCKAIPGPKTAAGGWNVFFYVKRRRFAGGK